MTQRQRLAALTFVFLAVGGYGASIERNVVSNAAVSAAVSYGIMITATRSGIAWRT